jgi:DNA-binding HxlR family transcriptional regulator
MYSPFLLNKAKELWGKKWRHPIMYILRNGPLRFKEIKSELPNCSTKVLAEVLKDMENNHLLIRVQYNTIPLKVTYELDPDLKGLTDRFDQYYNDLALYFYKSKEKHGFPPEIVEFLKSNIVTK